MRVLQFALLLLFAVISIGCRGGQNNAGANAKPFMNDKKQVPARLEWSRDVFAKKPGTIRYRISTSQSPFGVLFVTDKAWQMVLSKAKDLKGATKEDHLHYARSTGNETVLEGTVSIPAGRSWVVVENMTDGPADIHIELYQQ